jgi:hypothetical protein
MTGFGAVAIGVDALSCNGRINANHHPNPAAADLNAPRIEDIAVAKATCFSPARSMIPDASFARSPV